MHTEFGRKANPVAFMFAALSAAGACSTSAPEGEVKDSATGDAGLACLEPISAICGDAADTLLCHWPSNPMALCTDPAGSETTITICDEYRVVGSRNVDVGGANYYDPRTGDLVASVGSYHINGFFVRCNAGPPHFHLPSACTHGKTIRCPDASVGAGGACEAGRGGASGSVCAGGAISGGGVRDAVTD